MFAQVGRLRGVVGGMERCKSAGRDKVGHVGYCGIYNVGRMNE